MSNPIGVRRIPTGSSSVVTTSNQEEKPPMTERVKGPGNVTLRRLGYHVAFDVNKDIIVGVTEKVTGYHVEYFTLPAQNANERPPMEIVLGENYDVVNITVEQWRTLLANEKLQPLNNLLNTYGKDILTGNSKETWRALSDDQGTIYGVPNMYAYSTEINNFMIARMDLLKTAGINKIPSTLDGFHDMLVSLKNFYGDKYIILAGPYKNNTKGSGSLTIPRIISSAFGIYNDWMIDNKGNVIYFSEHENFNELVRFLASCAKERLFDADWPKNTNHSTTEKFASGKAIISTADRNFAQSSIPILQESLGLKETDFEFISALEGADGTCNYMESTAINYVSGILKTSKNASDAVNWMNLKVQNQLLINIGEEGVHFKYDIDGAIIPINPIFTNERGNSYYYNDVTNEEAFKKQWPSRIRKSAAQWLAFNAVTIKANAERPQIFVKNAFAYMPASYNHAKYNLTLLNSLNDFIQLVMIGAKTVSDIITFNSHWKEIGGELVRADMIAYLANQ